MQRDEALNWSCFAVGVSISFVGFISGSSCVLEDFFSPCLIADGYLALSPLRPLLRALVRGFPNTSSLSVLFLGCHHLAVVLIAGRPQGASLYDLGLVPLH